MIDHGKRAMETVSEMMESFLWLSELEEHELTEMAENLDFLHILVIEELSERE
jgi:hypothetical protein